MILLLGPPGSGKGVQSRLLAQKTSYKIFAIGELLRREIVEQTEYGKLIQENIEQGKLANLSVVEHILNKHVLDEKYILDGFPRDLSQALVLKNFIDAKNIEEKNIIVFDLIVPPEIIKNRIQERKLCQKCHGALEKHSTSCNFCNNENLFYIRKDDADIDAIAHRINFFNQEQKKNFQLYFSKARYYQLDATKSIQETHHILLNLLY